MLGSLRWRLAILITAAIAISYFDRQTLPVAVHAIQRDIPISNTAFSRLQAAFLVAYALMYAGGGKLLDTLGTRRGFLVIMVWWSLACFSLGLASNVAMFGVSLFLLGMGEGGGFPAATKAIAEWFPPGERSTAMGMVNAGTAVGAVAAPPLIAVILTDLNWHWVFFFSGAVGLLWTLWWARQYYSPQEHPALSAEERIAWGGSPDLPAGRPAAAAPWIGLLRFRQVWGMVTAKFLSDAAWYFYIFWLPKYLYEVRHFDTKQVGYYAWIPYAASGAGSLLGGWFSSRLIRRGRSLTFARKLALGASAAVMPVVFFVTQSPVQLAIVLFSIAFAGQQSWSTLVMTLPADLFPRREVGSVAGMVGFGGAMGGVVFGLVVGFLLDHGFGYGVVFALVSTFHVIAFCIILATVRVVEPIRELT
ncbi:MAG TPA: MFS transporter [Bryobacteraceae bacterium]|nr:MFS transporter [Bryobacteraceae bacterium]